jgi:hypothetical protein
MDQQRPSLAWASFVWVWTWLIMARVPLNEIHHPLFLPRRSWFHLHLVSGKDYLSKTPDPCAEAGLECCGGQCALPGCETDVECLQCKALMAGSSIPSEVQKEICEDPKRLGGLGEPVSWNGWNHLGV